MRLEQLEQLIQIQQWGSFNIAAQYLHMTHQNLSRSIQQLEKELNITIFLRNSKGVTLTADGEIVYSFAVAVYNEYQKMQHTFHTRHQSLFYNDATQSYQLNVALSSSLDLVFNPLLHNIMSYGHHVTTSSYELNMNECLQAANTSIQYDLIFIQNDYNYLLNHSRAAANYHLFVLYVEKLELITNKNSPYAQHKSISRSVLETIPLLVFSHDSSISNVAQVCIENHVKLNIVSYTNIVSTAHELLIFGQQCVISVPSAQGMLWANPLTQDNLVSIPLDIPIRIATAVYIKKELCETSLGQTITTIFRQAYGKTMEQIY